MAQVSVCDQGEVHGPDEDRPVRGLERPVQVHVEPEPAPDPHQPGPLAAADGGAGRDPVLDLLVKGPGDVAGPLGAPVPLRDHHARDAVVTRRGTGRAPGHQIPGPAAPPLLLVHQLHDLPVLESD